MKKAELRAENEGLVLPADLAAEMEAEEEKEEKEKKTGIKSENKEQYKKEAQESYKKWKKAHAHYQDSENDSKAELDIKNDVKLLPQRIHPNICDYNHLDDVDSGAKLYDSALNAAIPDIIELVDFYKDNETIDGIH